MTPLFKIFQVDAAEAEKISAAPDEPHHHDFEELIIGVRGRLRHFIDFKTTVFEAPFATFVTKGKIHRIIPEPVQGECLMWALRFKSELIPETTFQLYSHYHDHANIPLQPDGCFNRLVTLCEMINSEMQSATPDLAVVRHLLSALFTMVESERRKTQPEQDTLHTTQNLTFKNFLKILEEHYHQPEGVEFYAEKLFMSVRNLNLIIQSILQQSVSEIIETRKLIEAKNLLVTTDKTISEIGFELGYKEKAHFSTVFKKKSGQTPTEFREEMRKLIS